ncbi:MAG: PEP-CTERM sorting domain-containing protein [Moorea sp. SIO3G5]|nr:PEP-CTERM sorting domain-containing protein [Moorena sp. SIO3G5]
MSTSSAFNKLSMATGAAFVALSFTAIQAGSAQAAILDFDEPGLSPGQKVTNQEVQGVRLGVFDQGTTGGQPRDLMIYNSACGGAASNCTGEDDDLFKPRLGNTLIISEDNDSSDPDDSAFGGTFTFDFGQSVVLDELTLLDIELFDPVRVTTFSESGNQEFNFFGRGNNLISSFSGFGNDRVNRLNVTVVNSAAVSAVSYNRFQSPPDFQTPPNFETPPYFETPPNVPGAPEPLTVFGSVTALGFGGWLKKKHARKDNKATPKA